MRVSQWWKYPFGIQVRLALAIALTAAIPVAGAVVFARNLVQQASGHGFVPEIQTHLDRALTAYGELARQTKRSMRLDARLLANDPRLLAAAKANNRVTTRALLSDALQSNPGFVELTVSDMAGETLASVSRALPLDSAKELVLEVELELGEMQTGTNGHSEVGDMAGPLAQLNAKLATEKAPFDEFVKLGEFIEAYASLARRRDVDERTYVMAFAVLLLGTIVIAVTVGSWVSRGVSTRIGELATAAVKVGKGDLSVRVSEAPADEVGQLGQAFNQMLSEVEGSRSRIEYLSRLASWQEMARRLAHEIKNPLTPIQLAVQEVHQRFRDLPAKDREIIDVTLEIVEAEVLTLRRLVREFSEFARLPQSERESMSLSDYLSELKGELDVAPFECLNLSHEGNPELTLSWSVVDNPMPVRLDPQMMRRALLNLVRNAVQASRGRPRVSVWITTTVTSRLQIDIEDDGPGIAAEVSEHLFEPYVTTKDDGTGLGLAIVKKIIMDHEGTISVQPGGRGGARFSISLPKALLGG